MRNPALALFFLITVLAAVSLGARAADEPAAPPDAAGATSEKPANEQVIEPKVDRRELRIPHIPSNDFEFGPYAGIFNTENFGAARVLGVRAGYHVTEDIFVEAVYGQTRVSDQAFRQILPSGLFPKQLETLRYYNLSAGFNVLPGEVFFGRSTAKVSAIYLIAGVGSTQFLDQRHLTVNGGFGVRLFLATWAAVQMDLRDHVFALDLLGTRKSTQNVELTGGVTLFF